jgi:hypothetical protein
MLASFECANKDDVILGRCGVQFFSDQLFEAVPAETSVQTYKTWRKIVVDCRQERHSEKK